MAMPGAYSNLAKEAEDLDEKLQTAFEQGHDADISANKQHKKVSSVDVEKGIQTGSTHSDERTLSDDAPTPAQEPVDPNVVDWDGPDDPANPQNWASSRKWGLIAVLAAVTLVTPLGSSFFAPGVPEVMRAFGTTSNVVASFVVSIYILGFAIGPLMIAPMSELYGRIWIFHVCNVLFVIFNIACALSTSMGMLVAFRFLTGCAGAAPLTIGGGVIADMFPIEKRAGAMAIWGLGPLLGPIIGPVCGGFLVEAKGWRWVFWVLAIVAGFFTILLFVFGRETFASTLLAQKTTRLQKETGNQELRSKLAATIPPREVFIRAIVRPMKMLLFSPIVFLMSLYVAVNYGVLYLLFTTITFVFEDKYHFSPSLVGLAFIGMGVGMIIGMGILGIVSDKIVKEKKAKGTVKPEHRLPLILTLPGGIMLPIGIFIYGWTTDKGVHWIVPIIGTSLIGIGNLSAMMTIQTYLVDAFTIHAASVIAASTILRSLFGAFIPLSGLSMYDTLGLGWGNSLLGFIGLALIPVPVIFRLYGERIRTNPRFQVNF